MVELEDFTKQKQHVAQAHLKTKKMYFGKGKTVLYIISALISLLAVTYFSMPRGDFDFLETSFLAMLKTITENNKPEPPDLAIENISLTKISDPSEKFNYYKYNATVVIKNHGGNFRNAQVVLSAAPDQENIFVKNSPGGLSLENGQSFVIDRYDMIFDGDYNGGEITLMVKMNDRVDYYDKNNTYTVDLFELPAKIKSIGLDEILKDDTFVLGFKLDNLSLNTDDLEVFTSDSLSYDESDQRYDEINVANQIYGYHRIENSSDAVKSEGWKAQKLSDPQSHSLKFSDDPFSDESNHFVYFKATNPKNGYYAFSNILKFNSQTQLSRAEFAKLFVDHTDIDFFTDGANYYEDISPEAWYTPYIQTLYNLGLIKSNEYKYFPDSSINRADVLRVVLDYFDVDLVIQEGAPHFEDVSEEHYIYPYTEGLYASGKGGIFGDSFNPDLPASKNYLKYLINEYQKNS